RVGRPARPVPPTLSTPRLVSLGQMVTELEAFVIQRDEVRELNFLLCGPIGAGKSSIINTINTIFKKRIYVTHQASSFTKCKVGTAQDRFLPFVLYDTMGLDSGDNAGMHPDDFITAVKGHMKEGYQFNPLNPLNENSPYYWENPSLSDRMHCLLFVIPADRISIMDSVIIQKMKTIKNAATAMGLPQVILMTRVDQACTLTNNDLHYVYNSKKIKDKMLECQRALDIKMNCIFPVKNYHEETDISEDVNCLMLHALTRIVQWADDYVDKYSNN
uniref:G domain-containing protein n=1 Tax=Astyanax mexicanus TaxID=7994 RepID=A0A3B1JI41_ASTMX